MPNLAVFTQLGTECAAVTSDHALAVQIAPEHPVVGAGTVTHPDDEDDEPTELLLVELDDPAAVDPDDAVDAEELEAVAVEAPLEPRDDAASVAFDDPAEVAPEPLPDEEPTTDGVEPEDGAPDDPDPVSAAGPVPHARAPKAAVEAIARRRAREPVMTIS